MDALVAGDINDPAVVQCGVENGQSFIFSHVHLVKHAEAAQAGTLADGALSERHPAVLQGVGADEGGSIYIHIHGHIPHRASEDRRQVFGQDIFARGLGAGQEQMLPAQEGRGGTLPDLPAVVEIAGVGDTVRRLGGRRMGVTEMADLIQQSGIDAFGLQFLKDVHGKYLREMDWYKEKRGG